MKLSYKDILECPSYRGLSPCLKEHEKDKNFCKRSFGLDRRKCSPTDRII
jgi:hypothetical protein